MPAAFLTLFCLNAFATFMLITMVFMVCGTSGMPYNVKVSTLVVSKLTRLMRLVGLSGKGKGGGPITPAHPRSRICSLTSLIVSSKYRGQENCGG